MASISVSATGFSDIITTTQYLLDVNSNVSLCRNNTINGTYYDLVLNGTNCTDLGNGSTTEPPPYELPHALWLTILLGIVASFVIIITVLGNILVLMSFVLERTIRQPTNYFIASLALSDLLIGTFSMPCFTLYLLLGKWPLGEIICDLWLALDWTVCLASQYTVFFITADRFCSVKIPAKYRNWRTDKKVRVMIALSWIIPAVVFFTSIVGWQYFVRERTVPPEECEVQFMSNPLFTFFLTLIYFWTTLFVMVGLYLGIYRVALKLQKRANEKHKKMKHAMEMAKDKSNKKGGAKSKESKKRIENNNARYLRGTNDTNTITTSFSRNSDNEVSKPSEEDRSSSPAFASDEEEGSSGDRKESCYVNSAVQTEPTLKGMLGTSFNHMSRLAFSISGTSVSASQASQSSDRDSSADEHQHHVEQEPAKPLLPDTLGKFTPIKEVSPGFGDVVIKGTGNSFHHQNSLLLDNDILDGIRYIDEDSLKSLTSSENMKLLAEIKDKPLSQMPSRPEESPIWRKRVTDDDKSLLVPISGDSGSSEAVSTITDNSKAPEKQNSKNKQDSGKANHRHKGENMVDNQDRLIPNSSNHKDAKGKNNKAYGSPLQSLVKSLRPSRNKEQKIKKAPKSKSENRARKALRTISIILGAYILCWTPYHVMVFIIGICWNGWACINLRLYYFTYWMCYLNSPINPFCYAFANAQFKRTFVRILKFDLHRT